MAISREQAEQLKDEPAVVCCKTEEGKKIAPEDLEDPNIFGDLEDSGLLELGDDVLTIGDVLDNELKVSADALTPLNSEMVDVDVVSKKESKEDTQEKIPETNTVKHSQGANDGIVKIKIDEGKGIDLQIPISCGKSAPTVTTDKNIQNETNEIISKDESTDKKTEEEIKRELAIKSFKINKVNLSDETKIENDKLLLEKGLKDKAIKKNDLVVDVELDIIEPGNFDVEVNTIMDVLPVATKKEGDLGEGITYHLDGVSVILTGTEKNGSQIGEFGSSEGTLEKNVKFDRPGAPNKDDYIIKVDVTIKDGSSMERPGPFAAHDACDVIIQSIREELKKLEESKANTKTIYKDTRRKGRPKILLVKEIMGQGAMHDNLILPKEPCGVIGGFNNVDLGNIPTLITPNEVRDGAIRAMTCIGPASKETTLHYFNEPLVDLLAKESELDLCGVCFIGSPQENDQKFYVSKRLGRLAESLDLDGAIVITEGFGNNHIDFASHIEEVGKTKTSVVGMTFAAEQGALIVGNKYMDAMVDLNKSKDGVETEILQENCVIKEDAKRAIAMLKNKIAGEEIEKPSKSWSQEIIDSNQEIVRD
ncbi:D-proline reductase (dithiol) proprotein PrdA [Natranaerobius trueperi]|uniref:D-proline reductase (Dithiol) proprotein PrdA n=1 Tax=Natranaerobius trueperi TaxID=759412 RepID=A0A226BZ95_9FIRM|nr:D-proline reductase (dithiol) proprotein PrdA [Natranaerobius trueperi]OWZ84368.1 D-proline reductase (dithiol) proprotein PrdA [Natranaerobius trueperi]